MAQYDPDKASSIPSQSMNEVRLIEMLLEIADIAEGYWSFFIGNPAHGDGGDR